VELQPTVEQQQEVAVQAAAPKQQGGVLGAQAGRPAAGQQDQGGVLGEIGAVTQSELPFTGLPLWIALLAGHRAGERGHRGPQGPALRVRLQAEEGRRFGAALSRLQSGRGGRA
jgi:hypothetical protein